MKGAGLHVRTDVGQEPFAPARIGLLTPYGGTNLGDGAIQTATMEGIRRHLPETRLWGITLNPNETARRHSIPCFPATGLLVSFYSESLFESVNGLRVRFSGNDSRSGARNPAHSAEPTAISRRDRIWQRLKAIPVVGAALRFLVKSARTSFVVVHEIRHISTSLRFVRDLDMVIVAGGGQLDEEWGGPWGHPYVLFRWALLTRMAGKKFVVLSVGVGELRTVLGRLFTKGALALACYRSYRDLVSKGLLEQRWPFTQGDACVPDLAFAMRLLKNETSSLPRERPLIVGIGPIAFGHATNWPTPAPKVYATYLSNLVEFVEKLDSMECKVVLFTSSGADRQVVRELKEKISQDYSASLSERICVPRVDTVDDFFAEVGKVDLVVASRLHGAILSHMLSKPVLAISFDIKVDTHMRDMGQSDYLLNIYGFSANDLIERFELLIRDAKNIKKTLNEHLLGFREPLEKQYQQLATLLRSSCEM